MPFNVTERAVVACINDRSLKFDTQGFIITTTLGSNANPMPLLIDRVIKRVIKRKTLVVTFEL